MRVAVEVSAALFIGAALAIVFSKGLNATPFSRLAVMSAGALFIAAPVFAWRLRSASTSVRHKSGIRDWLIAVAVLLAGGAATFVATHQAVVDSKLEASARFAHLTERVVAESARRVNQTHFGLTEIRGVYAASKSVERNEFAAYVASRDLPREFPGALGFGFVERVPGSDLEDFVKRERADDAPDFQVKDLKDAIAPATDAPDLWVIKHCFPYEPNRQAWGLNIGSESLRREAAELAARTGAATITRRINLVQDDLHRPGFLYFVPIYRNGTHPQTPDERMNALVGLAYAPIVLDEAMLGLEVTTEGMLDVEVFDGSTANKAGELFDLDGHLSSSDGEVTGHNFVGRMFHSFTRTKVGEREWTFATSTTPAFEATVKQSAPLLIGSAGALLSTLVSLLSMVLLTSRQHALGLAQAMTADLARAKEDAEASLREVQSFRSTLDQRSIVSIADRAGRIIDVNEQFCRISGYTREELIGNDHRILNSGVHPKQFWVEVWKTLASGKPWRGEVCNRTKDGSLYWVDSIIAPFLGADGRLDKYISIRTDITARKDAERRIVESEQRLRSIIEAEPECVKVLNLDGTLRDMNAAGLEMLEAESVAEVLSLGLDHFVAPQYRAAFHAMHTRAARGERGSLVFEVVGVRGTRRWLDARVVPLRDASHGVTGVLAVTRDMTEQRTSQLELARRNRALEEMESVAQVGGWEVDLRTNQAYWTEQTFRIHEIDDHRLPTVEEAIRFYAPEAQPIIRAAVERGIETGEPWDLELPFITAKGRRIWVRAGGRVEMEHGRAVRMHGGFQDITPQVEQRLAQRAQSERMDLTVKSANLGTWDWNVTTGHVTYNAVAEIMLGYDPGDWEQNVGQWERLLHPEDRQRVLGVLEDYFAGRTFEYRCDYRLKRKDDSWAWILGVGRVTDRDASGAPSRMMGIHMDISEQKAYQHSLAASERKARAIFDQTYQFIGLLDPEGRVLDANRTAIEFAGVNSEQVIGRYFWDTPWWNHSTTIQAQLKEAIAKAAAGTFSRFETMHQGPDGLHAIDFSIKPIYDDAGKVAWLVPEGRDITDLRKREEELRAAKLAAESASRAKSEFLANMSHEIRTPLTAILGFADVLREDSLTSGAPEHRVQTIDTIRSAGQHLLTVINDILDLSKIEADKMTVERVETPLIAVLHEVASLCRPRAAGKGVRLDATLASPLPLRIISDPTRLRQILMNLTGNAVKFTEAGLVQLRALCATNEAGERLIVEVTDTGPGMTQDQAAQLFRPFTQADSTVTRKHGGTGLGLSICRRLAALMGGSVTLVHTALGRGSTFRLELPLKAVAGTRLVHAMDSIESVGSGHASAADVRLDARILLAEDGVDNQRLIAFHMKRAGASVDIADNGRIALDMLETARAQGHPYDLLLTDMQMPEMDGYTLAHEVRSRGDLIPIIALTAHAMAEDRDRCLQAGCNDYASKPVDKAALLGICARWLEVSRSAKAA